MALTTSIKKFSKEPDFSEGFSCVVVGRVLWTTLSPYGNWVPKDAQSPDDIKFPVTDPTKALHRLTIDIGPEQAALLQHIEDAVFGHPNFLPNKSDTYFKKHALLSNNSITMVSKIFKSIREYENDHPGGYIGLRRIDPDGIGGKS